jgi:hypothetical protein
MPTPLPAPRVARRVAVAVTAACLVSASAAGMAGQSKDDKDEKVKRPSLSLKVNPAITFAPARIVVTAELRGGGPNDPELYCPEVEWDWGDGTRSEATENCDPFEPGKSEVKRRWTVEHSYDTSGSYRIVLRLKRGDKTIVSGNTTLQVRSGLRDQEPFE